MAGRGHQVHGEEPQGELGPGLLERGANARVDVVPAMLAGVCPALGHPVELALGNTASRAGDLSAAVPTLHDLVQACPVVRIFSLKLLDRVLHGLSLSRQSKG